MFTHTIRTITAAVALALSLDAGAALLVDTGTPVPPDAANPLQGSLAFDATDWLAGQFSVDHDVTVDSVKAWLNDMGNGGTAFTVALYADSGANLPGTLLQSATGTYAGPGGTSSWSGASNLLWNLQAGKTYWVAFESDLAPKSFFGVAPVQAPNPLARYAFNDGGFLGYRPMTGDNTAFGVQINAVPEPETWQMFIAGAAVLVVVARRRKA